MKLTFYAFLIAGLSVAAPDAYAADAAANYPSRPIRIIDVFVAGGPSDILARRIGQKLTEAWGQPVVIDNRGGAGGILGTDVAAQATPDGYTLLLGAHSALAINPSVYKKLPYDTLRDFAPVTQLTSAPNLMVVIPSVPAKTVPEYIALAKAKPGYLNHAHTGAGNLLAMELFNHMAGIKTVGISYKGAAQAFNALLAGEVHSFIISPLGALPHIKAGKLRALGLTGTKRSPMLPDLPTVAETLPGFESVAWHSVVAPAKTPKPIIAKLSKEIVRIAHLPEIKEWLTSQGLEVVGSTPEEFDAFIRREVSAYAKLVKQIGFQPL